MSRRRRARPFTSNPLASHWYDWRTLQLVRNYLEAAPDLRTNEFEESILESLTGDLDHAAKEKLYESIVHLTEMPPDLAKDLHAVLFSDVGVGGALEGFMSDRSAVCITPILNALSSWIWRLEGSPDEGFAARLAEVTAVLDLDGVTRELLTLVYLKDQQLGVFGRYLSSDSLWSLKSLADTASLCLRIDRNDLRTVCSPRGILFQLDLLRASGPDSPVDLHEGLVTWLGGASDAPSFLETLFDVVAPLDRAVRPVNVDDRDHALCRRLLAESSGANPLLYGEPGTGKTTLAYALCHELGLQILEVRNSESGGLATRTANLKCALRIASKRPNCVVLVDEADLFLGTGRSWSVFGESIDKGWLNKILERSDARAIWITNEMRGIEPSTLRRFDYALCFEPYTTEQRRQVWTAVLAEVPDVEALLTPEEVRELADRYPLQPSHIADTVRRIIAIAPPKDEGRWMLERMLDSHARRLGLRTAGRATASTGPQLSDSAAALNVDIDLARLTAAVDRFLRMPPTERPASPVKNLCTLLYGPPGTGKTEFARNLARSLGRELQAYTAAELLDKFVGETEKRIAAAFDRAERTDAILFIDEADSFLWSRESATRSWEVSMVNEFLKRMEDFRGVLVCASNFMDRFDDASVRRFAFKARFGWLEPRGKLHFFERILGPLLPGGVALSDAQSQRLGGIRNLGPGDFKVVLQTHAFLPPAERTVDHLLAALERESGLKDLRGGRTIGFRD